MMSAVPDTSDLRRSSAYSPTEQLPVVPVRGVYHAAGHRRRLLLGAGAAGLVLVLLVGWLVTSGGDQPAPAAAPPAPSSQPAETPTEEPAATGEPAEAPTTAATTTPVKSTPVPPRQLVAQMIALVRTLERSGDLDDDAAEALNRRLKRLADRLRRDPERASGPLKDFAKKLADLREDDDVSQTGFDSLAAGAAQIAAALPGEPRRR
jgi:hypothetical protein